jgi:hypothetical protein
MYSNLEEVIAHNSFNAVIIATALLAILTTLSLGIKKQGPSLKKFLFWTISAVTMIATLFLAVSTVYLNVVSSSGGPVHWHTDIEIFNCGNEVNIKDPKGLSNKIGSPTLHEHNDKRIHLEGVVVEEQDASLGKFFHVIGGKISDSSLTVPTNEGNITLNSGSSCPDGQEAELQVFAFKVEGKNYTQEKLANPAEYVISPESGVPPGDCIIFELDKPKDRTDELCLSFEVAKQIGKLGEEVN